MGADCDVTTEERPPERSFFDVIRYGASLPERLVRSAAGLTAGTAKELAEFLVPRSFQDSKTYEVVVANSLIQYLSEDELKRTLATWLARLKPGGELILADVIPPDLSPLTDATELLGFAWRGGFLVAALGGLVRTVFSDYRKLRAQYGLSTYSAVGITALVEAAGFKGVTRVTNFGHNPHRMAFSARKPSAPEVPAP